MHDFIGFFDSNCPHYSEQEVSRGDDRAMICRECGNVRELAEVQPTASFFVYEDERLESYEGFRDRLEAVEGRDKLTLRVNRIKYLARKAKSIINSSVDLGCMSVICGILDEMLDPPEWEQLDGTLEDVRVGVLQSKIDKLLAAVTDYLSHDHDSEAGREALEWVNLELERSRENPFLT